MKESRILITGANGFLGHHLKNKLGNVDKNVFISTPSSKKFDLTKMDATQDLFSQFRPNIVLHMAAVCGGIGANKDRPADFLHLNTMMTSNIFEAANKYSVEYMYTLGSVCCYPLHTPIPFKEDYIWSGYPEPTNAPYGISKRLQMMMQETFRQQYGLKGAHFIPVNMFGSHDHFDLKNSHVIPALIRKFITAKEMSHDKVEVWGTGEATREFLHADDCASALVKALLTNFDYDKPINLGTGKSISILDLANKIKTLVGFQGELEFTGDEAINGQPKRQLDVSRAKEVLDWESKISLDEGLKSTIAWYIENKEEL